MTATGKRTANYSAEELWLPASEGIADWGEGFHDLLLGDRLRMDAFRMAIQEAVRPGCTVLDLGTGTGILALWALQAGAARVYGIDFSGSVLKRATTRLGSAGYGDRFRPVCGLSFDVTLPERADVIVSETLGNLVDNEGCTGILADARRRFLSSDGIIIPAHAESYLVPVAAQRAHTRLRRREIRGGDEPGTVDEKLRRASVFSVFDTYYDTVVPMETYLATPRMLRSYTFGFDERGDYVVSRSFFVQHDGTFTGFKGYFIASLSGTVVLDISGDDIAGGTTSDSWKHCYLPVRHPVEVRRGDRILLTLARSDRTHRGFPIGQDYRWEGRVMRGTDAVARFSQRTRNTDNTGCR